MHRLPTLTNHVGDRDLVELSGGGLRLWEFLTIRRCLFPGVYATSNSHGLAGFMNFYAGFAWGKEVISVCKGKRHQSAQTSGPSVNSGFRLYRFSVWRFRAQGKRFGIGRTVVSL